MSKFRKRLKRPSKRDSFVFVLGFIVTVLCFGIVFFVRSQTVPLSDTGKGITSPWIPSTVKKWQTPINEMAKKYNVDPNLIAIIMTIESGGYAKAGSEADAKGLMQITPLTAQDIASKYLKQPTTHYNIWDPKTNIEFGTAYLALLRDEFGSYKQGPDWTSTVELVAAGYNGGPGAANSLETGKGLNDTQTVVYSRDAFNMWRERNSKDSPTFDRWKERGGSTLLNLAKDQK